MVDVSQAEQAPVASLADSATVPDTGAPPGVSEEAGHSGENSNLDAPPELEGTASSPESTSESVEPQAADRPLDVEPEGPEIESETASSTESGADIADPASDEHSEEFAEDDPAPSPPAAVSSDSDTPVDAADDAEAAPDQPLDEPEPADDLADSDIGDETAPPGDTPEDGDVVAAAGLSSAEVPAVSDREFVEQEQSGTPEPSTAAVDTAAGALDERGSLQTRERPEAIGGAPGEGRRDRIDHGGARAPAEPAGDDGEDTADMVRAAGRQDPVPASSGSMPSYEGELARAIREAERDAREADRDARQAERDAREVKRDAREVKRDARQAERDASGEAVPELPMRDPKTEEELIAAAKKLGISFRDDPGDGRSRFSDEQENEIKRAARELGISFRDDSATTGAADLDDPMAKAVQELGISFRNATPPKAKPQSTLRQYWPIILVMAIAAIAMPLATAYFMLSFD